MKQKLIPPAVSAPDTEGFQTFSFYTDQVGETIRVSFNPQRMHEYLAKTSSDPTQYLPREFESLKTAGQLWPHAMTSLCTTRIAH